MAAGTSDSIKNHASFIWSVADLLRGDYKQWEYEKVILPLTVLRRFDCVLAPVKADMLARYAQLQGKVENFGPIRGEVVRASRSSLLAISYRAISGKQRPGLVPVRR